MINRVVRWITVRLFQSTSTSIQASEDRRLKVACVVKDEEPTAIGGTNLEHIGENGVHELPICTRRRRASRSTRTADNAAGLGSGVFAILQHLRTVDEDIVDSGRQLLWLLEGRMVLDRCRVE